MTRHGFLKLPSVLSSPAQSKLSHNTTFHQPPSVIQIFSLFCIATYENQVQNTSVNTSFIPIPFLFYADNKKFLLLVKYALFASYPSKYCFISLLTSL